MKLSKNLAKIAKKHDKTVPYSLDDAVGLVQGFKFVKFDESVDLAINLDVDPRHAEENIRVTTPLPHGTGNEVSILVLASGPKEKEAADAGADYVGNKEYLTKIKKGCTDVDKIVATPDMMGELGKLGKILGPKGLMPNPKLGSVTNDIKKSVLNAKSGQVEIKNDKDGNIALSLGKKSFSDEKLIKNFNTIFETLEKEKSNMTIKGDLVRSAFLTSTMGVSYKIKLPKNI